MSNIRKREITEELREAYLDYAMSVIVSRALPDVRDGMKPVQRRILWGMWDSGSSADAKLKKSANIVGEVMGKYHPHGDLSIYDTLVRMAQDFSMRYPLVQGQGNFGSIDGDSPAAMRYTETRLARVAHELLDDIEKDTVDWMPNYDASRDEPKVLPAKLPNLLLNGALGIAVGMTTSIPPHNLREIADAILHLLKHPDATVDDLLEFVQGPDLPTGGIIFDKNAICEAYTSGKGGIIMRAKADIEERTSRQFDIIITEIPYMVNKADLVKRIAELVQAKKIEGIRDVRDESDREGLRVVVELRNDVPPQKILNQLYEHTDLQRTFHMNMIVLVNGIEPRLLSLRDVLVEYVNYRKEVVKRHTAFDLARAKEREHILEGLSKALHVIDKIIAAIKRSNDKEEAHKNLVAKFKLTAIQATAILEMRLQALAALERQKIEDELKEKRALIKALEAILKSATRVVGIIEDEVKELVAKYGDRRRTQVVPTGITAFKDEDLIPEEEVVITLSAGGYIKRLPPATFRSQGRGGKGLIGSEVAEEDFLQHFLTANTHNNILFFTDRGRVFQTKVYEIPAASRTSKGRAVHNFLELSADETVSAIVAYRSEKGKVANGEHLVMVTKNGLIKKTPLKDFMHIRRTGIIAIALKKGDALQGVQLSSGKDEVIITTAKGQSIRFKESQVRPMGRSAAGVTAIKLRGDHVAGFDIITGDHKQPHLLVVMANGFGKQTPLKEYKIQGRGGSGIRTANVTTKTGQLIAAQIIDGETEVLALSAKGQIIRTELKSVRRTGRSAQGVRIMNLKSSDRLAGVVIL